MRTTDKNKKLAEFCWFKEIEEFRSTGRGSELVSCWLDPEGFRISGPPNIYESLPKLFELAVPQLHKKLGVNISVGINTDGEWYAHIAGMQNCQFQHWEAKEDTAATSLSECIAQCQKLW